MASWRDDARSAESWGVPGAAHGLLEPPQRTFRSCEITFS